MTIYHFPGTEQQEPQIAPSSPTIKISSAEVLAEGASSEALCHDWFKRPDQRQIWTWYPHLRELSCRSIDYFRLLKLPGHEAPLVQSSLAKALDEASKAFQSRIAIDLRPERVNMAFLTRFSASMSDVYLCRVTDSKGVRTKKRTPAVWEADSGPLPNWLQDNEIEELEVTEFHPKDLLIQDGFAVKVLASLKVGGYELGLTLRGLRLMSALTTGLSSGL